MHFDDFNEIYDISPLISEQTAVFPGDVAFERNVLMSQEQGAHLDLSSMTTTLHIGAHADAVSHYGPNEPGIDQKDLRTYMGHCQVIEVNTAFNQRISLHDFEINSVASPRVLFKTNSFRPNEWSNDFVSLSPEVVQALADSGVLLVGLDTPSIDPATSKKLESHQAVLKNNMSILEGLVLEDVPVGQYQLIALPLKIKDGDASPVRAILCK